MHSAEHGKAVVKEAVMHVLQEQLGLPVIAAFSNLASKRREDAESREQSALLSNFADSDNNEQAVRYTNHGRVIVPRAALNEWLAKPRSTT